MTTINHIDARGKTCPVPLMLLKQAMAAHPSASSFTIQVTDPHAELDVLTWCERHGYDFVALSGDAEGPWMFQISR